MSPLQPNNWSLFYTEALQELGRTVGDLCQHSTYSCEDWLYWAEEHQPDMYKDLESSIEKANGLWGLHGEIPLQMFKKAVRQEIEITKSLIPLYLEWQAKQEMANISRKAAV